MRQEKQPKECVWRSTSPLRCLLAVSCWGASSATPQVPGPWVQREQGECPQMGEVLGHRGGREAQTQRPCRLQKGLWTLSGAPRGSSVRQEQIKSAWNLDERWGSGGRPGQGSQGERQSSAGPRRVPDNLGPLSTPLSRKLGQGWLPLRFPSASLPPAGRAHSPGQAALPGLHSHHPFHLLTASLLLPGPRVRQRWPQLQLPWLRGLGQQPAASCLPPNRKSQ